MKVAGFTFIRNAIKFDFPIVEAILSILPICDEFVVAVGKSEDETLALIQGINSPKLKIIATIWDENLRQGGRVLAEETNKALAHISPDVDWAFYLQGDEVVHEQDWDTIQKAMQRWKDDRKVEGLLFKYIHFYGSYQYIGDSRQWYRCEVRIIRPNIGVFSYKDAQGFRKKPNQKLKVKLIDAYIYHYGWVKPPKQQLEKRQAFHKLWHNNELLPDAQDFDYSLIDSLQTFQGTHPAVMQQRYQRYNWHFHFDTSKVRTSFKNKVLHQFFKLTGIWLFEYRNYKKI